MGNESLEGDPGHVHTIDVWFSKRRGAWIVERLSGDGHQIGAACRFPSEDEARDCLQAWLRAHSETHLAAPRHDPPAAAQTARSRRHAA